MKNAFGDGCDMTPHIDSLRATSTPNMNTQDAAPAHLDALFADEVLAGSSCDEIVTHHVCGERASRTGGDPERSHQF